VIKVFRLFGGGSLVNTEHLDLIVLAGGSLQRRLMPGRKNCNPEVSHISRKFSCQHNIECKHAWSRQGCWDSPHFKFETIHPQIEKKKNRSSRTEIIPGATCATSNLCAAQEQTQRARCAVSDKAEGNNVPKNQGAFA
jgi:hypothetical protein